MPIEDYSPFLVADPESYKGRGSNGGPQIAVSDRGDVLLSYRGRGRNGEFDYLYTRAAGRKDFKESKGPIRMGRFWGDRMYTVSTPRDGKNVVRSARVGESNWKDELKVDTGIRFGSSVTRMVDGYLVAIAEDRGNSNTDKQKIHCFAFQVGPPLSTSYSTPNSMPSRITHTLTNKQGKTIEAKLIDVRHGRLICIINGEQMEVPIALLRDEDIEFLRKWYADGTLE